MTTGSRSTSKPWKQCGLQACPPGCDDRPISPRGSSSREGKTIGELAPDNPQATAYKQLSEVVYLWLKKSSPTL